MDTSQTRSAIAEASGAARSAAESLSAHAHHAVEQVGSTLHRAAEKFPTDADQWMAAKDELATGMRRLVRERPLATLGAAIVLGYLLKRLLR
jgi:ElaB/YqjD/DUF883 family membrane-anchored ribosome-binding protein